MLTFLARRLAFDPIVVLAAATGRSRAGMTGASLPELRLRRLDRATAVHLLHVYARDLSEVERDRILREAAGNPLALIELPKAGAGLESGPPLPGLLRLTDRLERSFAARTSDFPAGTRLLLLVTSLLDGDDIHEVPRAATSAAGHPIGLEALEVAAEAGMIELDLQTVRFRHPMMRSAVRQSARIAQRRHAHDALATMLARTGPPRLAPSGAYHGRAREHRSGTRASRTPCASPRHDR